MTEFKKEIATTLGDAVLGESVSDRSAIMPDHRLPHERFLDRVARDCLVDECVLHYELAEVRLLSEKTQLKTELGSNCATTTEDKLRRGPCHTRI